MTEEGKDIDETLKIEKLAWGFEGLKEVVTNLQKSVVELSSKFDNSIGALNKHLSENYVTKSELDARLREQDLKNELALKEQAKKHELDVAKNADVMSLVKKATAVLVLAVLAAVVGVVLI